MVTSWPQLGTQPRKVDTSVMPNSISIRSPDHKQIRKQQEAHCRLITVWQTSLDGWCKFHAPPSHRWLQEYPCLELVYPLSHTQSRKSFSFLKWAKEEKQFSSIQIPWYFLQQMLSQSSFPEMSFAKGGSIWKHSLKAWGWNRKLKSKTP